MIQSAILQQNLQGCKIVSMVLYLTTCCHQDLFWPQNLDGISKSHCSRCRKEATFYDARSHCCLAPIEVVNHQFPYICKSCEGSCEPAAPGTPSHYDDVQSMIRRCCDRVREGSLTPEEAYKVISKTLDEEIETTKRETCEDIQGMIVANSLPPLVPFDPVTSGIVKGFGIAMQVFDKIIADALDSSPE